MTSLSVITNGAQRLKVLDVKFKTLHRVASYHLELFAQASRDS